MEQLEKDAEKNKKKSSLQDMRRFYYYNSECASKHTSVSLDALIVTLLEQHLGSFERVKFWIKEQANRMRNEDKDVKSISRRIQENAIKLIANPVLYEKLEGELRAEFELEQIRAQAMVKNGANRSKKREDKRSGGVRL